MINKTLNPLDKDRKFERLILTMCRIVCKDLNTQESQFLRRISSELVLNRLKVVLAFFMAGHYSMNKEDCKELFLKKMVSNL